MIIGWGESQKMGNRTSSGHLDGFQSVDAKVGHQLLRGGTLDETHAPMGRRRRREGKDETEERAIAFTF